MKPNFSWSVGYLVSRYPAVSHTFILREILYMRSRGCRVETLSINPPDKLPSWHHESDEAKEINQTTVIKSMPLIDLLKAFCRVLWQSPWRSLKTLAFSLQQTNGSPKKLAWHIFYWLEALVTVDWMRQKDLSHLHVHFANPAAFVALLASDLNETSYSLTIHGPDELENSEENLFKLKVERAQKIFCISFYARSQVWRYLDPKQWNKVSVTPLGIDTQRYIPCSIDKSSSLFRLLCVGRLSVVKGQLLLLQVTEKLRKQGLEIEVDLVGDGSERSTLEKWIQQKAAQSWVFLRGALSQEETFQAYRNADLFVLPSFAEGVPIVLMEAMAMEIPCISSRINGIPELIRDGTDGILTAPSNQEELSQAIVKLLQDSQRRKKLGLAGRKRIMDKYEFSHNCEKFYLELKSSLEDAKVQQ